MVRERSPMGGCGLLAKISEKSKFQFRVKKRVVTRYNSQFKFS